MTTTPYTRALTGEMTDVERRRIIGGRRPRTSR